MFILCLKSYSDTKIEDKLKRIKYKYMFQIECKKWVRRMIFLCRPMINNMYNKNIMFVRKYNTNYNVYNIK